MDGYLRKLKRATIVYWVGVWSTIVGIMIAKAISSPRVGDILFIVFYVAVFSGVFVAGQYYFVKRLLKKSNAAIIFSCWISAPVIFHHSRNGIIGEGRLWSHHRYRRHNKRNAAAAYHLMRLVFNYISHFSAQT